MLISKEENRKRQSLKKPNTKLIQNEEIQEQDNISHKGDKKEKKVEDRHYSTVQANSKMIENMGPEQP